MMTMMTTNKNSSTLLGTLKATGIGELE